MNISDHSKMQAACFGAQEKFVNMHAFILFVVIIARFFLNLNQALFPRAAEVILASPRNDSLRVNSSSVPMEKVQIDSSWACLDHRNAAAVILTVSTSWWGDQASAVNRFRPVVPAWQGSDKVTRTQPVDRGKHGWRYQPAEWGKHPQPNPGFTNHTRAANMIWELNGFCAWLFDNTFPECNCFIIVFLGTVGKMIQTVPVVSARQTFSGMFSGMLYKAGHCSISVMISSA